MVVGRLQSDGFLCRNGNASWIIESRAHGYCEVAAVASPFDSTYTIKCG